MNRATLLALLYLSYSVAHGCVTTGELEYELFRDYGEEHKKLLKTSLRKDFDERDLVVNYQVNENVKDSDAIDIFFPTVILSRKYKRPTYFILRPVSNIKIINAKEFIDTLYNCTLPAVPLVRLIE